MFKIHLLLWFKYDRKYYQKENWWRNDWKNNTRIKITVLTVVISRFEENVINININNVNKHIHTPVVARISAILKLLWASLLKNKKIKCSLCLLQKKWVQIFLIPFTEPWMICSIKSTMAFYVLVAASYLLQKIENDKTDVLLAFSLFLLHVI